MILIMISLGLTIKTIYHNKLWLFLLLNFHNLIFLEILSIFKFFISNALYLFLSPLFRYLLHSFALFWSLIISLFWISYYYHFVFIFNTLESFYRLLFFLKYYGIWIWPLLNYLVLLFVEVKYYLVKNNAFIYLCQQRTWRYYRYNLEDKLLLCYFSLIYSFDFKLMYFFLDLIIINKFIIYQIRL